MGRVLSFGIAAALVAVGLLMVLPALRTLATHQRADGLILAAHAVPEGAGMARVAVLYRFPAGEADGGVVEQLAARQADQHFRPIPDPLLPIDQARQAARERIEGDRSCLVYFRPEDPEGTAFILEEAGGRPGRRALTGAALVVVGLFWWLSMRRRRPW